MSNTNNDMLTAMLAQYESTKDVGKPQTTFSLDNYFTTYLPDGVDQAIKRVRIIPTKGTPFKEVHFHSATVDGKNRKFACLEKLNNEPCPFCEARAQLLSTGDEEDKEIAKDFKPRQMYIVKVIDRENEAHGPKFWRFPAQLYKKDGIHDKIMANLQIIKENIGDPETGRDLYLSVTRVKNPRGGSYPTVNSVSMPVQTPLSEDADQLKAWTEDSRTWQDVYPVKTYDYLEIVVKGGIPTWDKTKEKFVDKASLEAGTSAGMSDELDEELEISAQAGLGSSQTSTASASYDADEDFAAEQDDDDLPF